MTFADIPYVFDIESTVFSLPWSEAAFYNELTDNQLAKYYVLEAKDTKSSTIIGYIGIWLILEEAHITTIAVKPEYQGQGLGCLLLETIMKECKAMGVQRMTLEVRVSNQAARKMYIKYGFVENGIRKKYYSDNGEDAIIMWVVLEEDERDESGTSEFNE
ncbi:ribosomal-protein-alanine N-acetyltransferase [Desulfuribacillus stibiiarsenatis]|uniref:Ribosomal-protein-alanine N-acetyltransferase n=1 Tax=Desulfuribacillus stibiiarsenatis TaxID=1390249 RepID=A0A1E5L570_9FIRM|nr:ribosomal-protein-alanine N-acetyltransferase [Desulfuribacillus stibiiarsenatis]